MKTAEKLSTSEKKFSNAYQCYHQAKERYDLEEKQFMSARHKEKEHLKKLQLKEEMQRGDQQQLAEARLRAKLNERWQR